MTKMVNLELVSTTRQGGAPAPGMPASAARHGEGDASPTTPHSAPAGEEVLHNGKDPENDAGEDSNDDAVDDDDDDSEYTYETDDEEDGSNQKKGWFGFLQRGKNEDEDSSDSEAEEEAEGSDDGSEYTYATDEEEDGSVNKKRGWFEFLRRSNIKHNGDHEEFVSSEEEDGDSSEEEAGKEEETEKGKKGSKKKNKAWFELLSLGRKGHSNADIDKSTFSGEEEDVVKEEKGEENKSTDNDVDDDNSGSQERGLFGFLRRGNRNPGGDHEEPIFSQEKDAHGSHNNQSENWGEDSSNNQGGQFIFFL